MLSEAVVDVAGSLNCQLATRSAAIKAMAAATGREPDQIVLSVRANIRLNPPAGATPSRFDGSSQDIVDAIGEYARVGVVHVLLAPDSGDVARLRDKTEQIARDVIPSFR